jgi:FkbM family methyltransferase
MTKNMSFADVMEMLVAVRDQTRKPDGNEAHRFLNVCLTHVSRSHAQLLQDLWVAFETNGRRGGYFVEFGAANGVHASNTLMLERDLGWTGILAEPGRYWQAALKANRPACAIDTRCVWRATGETLTFNEPAIALHATIEAYTAADALAGTRDEGKRYAVETVSLGDLLAHWKAPKRIDYLSVDTEGSELDILAAFDFAAWDVRLISVEHNHTEKREALFELLTAKGYRRRFQALSGVDDWYAKAD